MPAFIHLDSRVSSLRLPFSSIPAMRPPTKIHPATTEIVEIPRTGPGLSLAYTTGRPSPPPGFALRGNLSDPAWATASNKAFDEGVAFLKTHLAPAGTKAPASLKVNLLKAFTSAVAAKPAAGAAAAAKP